MASERWTVDPSHSGIHFAVRHLVIAKVRGQFTRWTGTIDTVQGTFDQPTVEVVIDAGSIETGVADRDAHLKSPDFLDAAQFPELRFTSTRFVPNGASGGQLVGALTIKGTTREVVLEVERLGTAKDPWGNERAAFSLGISEPVRDAAQASCPQPPVVAERVDGRRSRTISGAM